MIINILAFVGWLAAALLLVFLIDARIRHRKTKHRLDLADRAKQDAERAQRASTQAFDELNKAYRALFTERDQLKARLIAETQLRIKVQTAFDIASRANSAHVERIRKLEAK